MTMQDTARAIFKQWAAAQNADPELPDILLSALRAELLEEAAREVSAMPLPIAVMASSGPIAQATRRVLNDASKKLHKLADDARVTCPPGTHGMFDFCPGNCRIPEVDA